LLSLAAAGAVRPARAAPSGQLYGGRPVKRQPNGRFTLLGYGHSPPAFDVELVAAAPIEVVLRGRCPRHRREVHPLSLSTNS